jgi:hypothetical protein
MIRPTKYLDLDTCVLRVAAVVLEEICGSSAMPIGEVTSRVCSRLGDTARLNLMPALGLLYLLGVLDYHDEADAVCRRGTGTENRP